jgi:hypothetical protein
MEVKVFSFVGYFWMYFPGPFSKGIVRLGLYCCPALFTILKEEEKYVYV